MRINSCPMVFNEKNELRPRTGYTAEAGIRRGICEYYMTEEDDGTLQLHTTTPESNFDSSAIIVRCPYCQSIMTPVSDPENPYDLQKYWCQVCNQYADGRPKNRRIRSWNPVIR